MAWQQERLLTLPRRSRPRSRQNAAPAFEPVTVQEARHHMRVEHTADDMLIGNMISAVRGRIESETNHVFGGRQWVSSRDHWESPRYDGNQTMDLLPGPVTAIDSIQYFTGGTLATLDSSAYTADLTRIPARLQPTGGYWPAVDDTLNAVQITFQAGYATKDEQPSDLVQAVLVLVNHWYENRSAYQQDGRVPVEVNRLLQFMLNEFTRGVY